MYIEFGMSQSKLHCINVGDEPMKKIWGQLDLIKIDDYFADSCAISPTAFLLAQLLQHNCVYMISTL